MVKTFTLQPRPQAPLLNNMSYTVAPHLEYFTIPLTKFITARPEFEGFGVGAYIFSHADSTPRVLLLQRALTDSMPGCWEGPGGACELQSDQTLLDSLVRETHEETGLHVSRVIDLVAVDCWARHRRNADKMRIVKYSFIVEVHETWQESGNQHVPTLQIPVQLDRMEHQDFDWATEQGVQVSMRSSNGQYKLPLPLTPHQGPNILRAFEVMRERSKAGV